MPVLSRCWSLRGLLQATRPLGLPLTCHVTVTEPPAGSKQVKILDNSHESRSLEWLSPLSLHSGLEGPRMVARGSGPRCAVKGSDPSR